MSEIGECIQLLANTTPPPGNKNDTNFKKDVWQEPDRNFNSDFKPKPSVNYSQIQTRMHIEFPFSIDLIVAPQILQDFSNTYKTK
jgi:hypothetical protein